MKKSLIRSVMLVLIAVLAMCLLAGCGGQKDESAGGDTSGGTSATVDLASIKTLGDAFALEGKDEDSEQRSTYDGKYYYAFTVGGTAYRVIADLPEDIEKKIFDLEFDDDYDKNEKALVADLPVALAEDLTEYIMPQEELDALVGKTGQELADMGWRGGSFYNGETKEAWLEFGPYAYSFQFDGEVLSPSADDFDEFEDLADRKVVKATFEGLGDATYME